MFQILKKYTWIKIKVVFLASFFYIFFCNCLFLRLITNHDNVVLQFTTARIITNYDNRLLQFTIGTLLQFTTTVITIHDRVLQFTTSVITIYDRYYNSRRYHNSRQNIRIKKINKDTREPYWLLCRDSHAEQVEQKKEHQFLDKHIWVL